VLRSFKKNKCFASYNQNENKCKKNHNLNEKILNGSKNFLKILIKKTKTAYKDEWGLKYLISCKYLRFKLKNIKKVSQGKCMKNMKSEAIISSIFILSRIHH
jgi:hypothetical protein